MTFPLWYLSLWSICATKPLASLMRCALVFLFGSLHAGEIKVLLTAAIIDSHYELRKAEYLAAIQALKEMNVIPYMVESIRTSSFLDDCKIPVFYSRTNDSSLRNKGCNEARALMAALKHWNFDDEDMIVKLTGRYLLLSDRVFSEIKKAPEVDAFAKLAGLHPPPFLYIDYVTGCFALRCKYLKQFLNELDLDRMEREIICIEWELGRFFQRHPEVKLCVLSTLDVKAHVFSNGHGYITFY